jgi:hypothetical protein
MRSSLVLQQRSGGVAPAAAAGLCALQASQRPEDLTDHHLASAAGRQARARARENQMIRQGSDTERKASPWDQAQTALHVLTAVQLYYWWNAFEMMRTRESMHGFC